MLVYNTSLNFEDSRMILHAADGTKQRYKNILIRTVDSDVVVLGFANRIECEKLTVTFGIGTSFRYLDVSRMALVLGNRKSLVLPVLQRSYRL